MCCWFRLVTKAVLVTHLGFTYCRAAPAQQKGLFWLCLWQVGWGGVQELGREHSWDKWPKLTEGVFSARRMSKTAGWSFWSGCLEAVWALGCWWEGGDCLCFTCVFLPSFFPSLLKMALSQPMSFSLLLWFKFSSPCLEVVWMSGWWALIFWPGSTRHGIWNFSILLNPTVWR